MSKIKIAIQGELGAYSHIAAESLYPGAEIKTCTTFEETFNQAHKDPSYKIVIPIENSLAGRVADIHYLLPKYKLQIHGEYFLPVEHNLLGKPDATMKDIKYVRSHAQAISQCQNIISKNNFQSVISVDTAGSAKDLAEGKDINYQGATDVEFNALGDAAGAFKELEVSGGEFVTVGAL